MKIKILSLFIFLILAASQIHAQPYKLSGGIHQFIEENKNSGAKTGIAVFFDGKVDFEQLKIDMDANGLAVKQRPAYVMKHLKKAAAPQQKLLLEWLKDHQVLLSAEEIHFYWLVNMAIVNLTADNLKDLSNLPFVAYMQLADEEGFVYQPPIESKPSVRRGPGMAEPGLRAINAHKLWEMGYTGRGTMAYSMDTGIKRNHPALNNRFLWHYFPGFRAWKYFDSYFPNDKTGTHGTHTTGTILGLEAATHDTIGAAFNAYFIAADPIVNNIADIRSVTKLVDAFEWAFNPDGDTLTTDDIPDVINNSWGRGTADTSLCVSFASEAFSAIEAAGFANVFSTGNNGPAPNTIGTPPLINTGLVNLFTVGAVDASNPNFPIASFSSRGPSPCGGTGSILIKPEVSAPGVNVRSAEGENGYGTKSGTSMAAPHVSGATLLLKEAFPMATGEEILLALYNSTMDLGDLGEDNTYGMGMIDVLAAFNLLTLSYTPVPPARRDYDIAIVSINNLGIGSMTCNNLFAPEIIIENKGDSIMSGFDAYVYYKGVSAIYPVNTSLSPSQKDTFSFPAIQVSGNAYQEIRVEIKPKVNLTEYDTVNNNAMIRMNLRETLSLPYLQDFETGNMYEKGLFIQNNDELVSWDTVSTAGLGNSLISGWMALGEYLPRAQQKDLLITPLLEIPDSGSLFISFDYSYQAKASFFNDSLIVSASDDCGITFPYKIYGKGKSDMNTHNTGVSVPELPLHWKNETIDISSLVGSSELLFKINTVNDFGGNLFLDNFSVQKGSPVGINETYKPIIEVFPNPVNGQAVLKTEGFAQYQAELRIYQITGKLIMDRIIKTNETTILNISHFINGPYLMLICQDGNCYNKLIIKQ